MGTDKYPRRRREFLRFQIHFGLMGTGRLQSCCHISKKFQIHFGLMGTARTRNPAGSSSPFQIHFGLMGTARQGVHQGGAYRFQIHFGLMGTQDQIDRSFDDCKVSNPLRFDGNPRPCIQIVYSMFVSNPLRFDGNTTHHGVGYTEHEFQIHFGLMGTEMPGTISLLPADGFKSTSV